MTALHAGLILAAVLLAACDTATPSTPGAQAPTPPSSAATAGPSVASSPIPIDSTPGTPAVETATPRASTAACTIWQLALAIVITPGRHGMNQVYHPVEFMNVSPEPCTLSDPDVVLTTTQDDRTIGQPTNAGVRPPASVSLAPGEVATAQLRTVNPDVLDPTLCTRVSALQVHWLRVMLPGQPVSLALYAPFTPETDVCSNGESLSILPLEPGRSPLL